MRPPEIRIINEPLLQGSLVIDLFAGGGGASTGIEAALQRPVDIAINHDAAAIAVHKANHPETKHYQEDIWAVDPREACGGKPVGLLWASPACTHFSRARGAANPKSAEIRSLSWVVVRWAKLPPHLRPKQIYVENVPEFETWGPLDPDGRPIPEKMGQTFRSWRTQLMNCGYDVDMRVMTAADYGSPTLRKRLFILAVLKGTPLAWPEPTHGKGRPAPWRTAAEIIDWSLPTTSIFNRKKPLAEATLKRIATGIRRFVIEASDPFIIPVTHQGDSRVYSIREPLRTVTGAHRGEFAYVNPFVVRHGHYSTKTGAGLREGCGAGTFRGQQLSAPLGTVCATNDKHLVAPIISKHYGGTNGHQVYGHGVGQPLGSITSRDSTAVTAAFLTKYYGTAVGAPMTDPCPTVTAKGQHIAQVRAFLLKYYGQSNASSLNDPVGSLTTKARYGLVYVHGEPYQIVDIGMRMLSPRELFRAQGFDDDYVIDIEHNGRPLSKEAQIRLAGNSVCTNVARSLVEANLETTSRRAA